MLIHKIKTLSSCLLIVAVALSMSLISCSSDDDMVNDVPGTSELTVQNEGSTFNFPYSGELSQTLTFSTNQCWRIVVEDESLSWVRFSKISGNAGENVTITINVDPLQDDAPDARTMAFKLIAGEKDQTFNVLQAQKDAIIILHPEKYQGIVYNEQNLDIDFVTNVDDYSVHIAYENASDNWLSIVQSRASHDEVIHLHVAANLVKTERKATLTIRSNTSDITVAVDIVQEGKPDPMVQITNKDEFIGILDKSGGEYIVTYRTVEIPDLEIVSTLNPTGNWAQVDTKEEGKIKVSIQPNSGRSTRTVTLTLSSKSKPELTDQIVLSQDLDRSITVDMDNSLQKAINDMGLTSADFEEIEIKGELSKDDWALLKKMATSENLKHIDLSGVTNNTMPNSTFMNCSKLESLILPQSGFLKEIPMEMCRNVAKLKTIAIPEGVTIINRHAFAACSGIETLYLPSTLTFMYGYCFEKTTALKDIHLKTKPLQHLDVPRGADTPDAKATVFNDGSNRPRTCTLYVPEAYVNLYKKSVLTLEDLGLTEWPEYNSWKATASSFAWTNSSTNVIAED